MNENVGRERALNYSHNFIINIIEYRICKLFKKNTFDVNYKRIRTVILKLNSYGFIDANKRGTHNQLNFEIKQSIRDNINSILYSESCYLRS